MAAKGTKLSEETRRRMSEAQKARWARQHDEPAKPKTKPPTHVMGGCLCCPPKPLVLDLDRELHPGFGMVYVIRDGQCVWPWGDEHSHEDITGRKVEEYVRDSSDALWEIKVDGPLFGCTYRRIDPDTWTMIEKNQGFA